MLRWYVDSRGHVDSPSTVGHKMVIVDAVVYLNNLLTKKRDWLVKLDAL